MIFYNTDTDHVPTVGLNNIYFENLSHTNLQNEQSGFSRKLQACKDHLPNVPAVVIVL